MCKFDEQPGINRLPHELSAHPCTPSCFRVRSAAFLPPRPLQIAPATVALPIFPSFGWRRAEPSGTRSSELCMCTTTPALVSAFCQCDLILSWHNSTRVLLCIYSDTSHVAMCCSSGTDAGHAGHYYWGGSGGCRVHNLLYRKEKEGSIQ